MTASLLAHVARNVPEDSIVRALQLLLHASRRHVLTLSLHKAILGLLFRSKGDLASTVLHSEWGNNALHTDVRYLLTMHVLASALRNNHDAAWAWSALLNFAKAPDLGIQGAIPLLSPVASYSEAQSFEKQLKDGSEDEMLQKLRQWFTRRASQETRNFFMDVVASLEQNISSVGLRRLAGIKRLDLTEVFENNTGKVVDEESLQELKAIMLSDHQQSFHDETSTRVWIVRAGRLFSQKILGVMSHAYQKRSAKLALENEARTFIHTVLDELLRRNTSNIRSEQLWSALHGIVGHLDDSSQSSSDCRTSLKQRTR